MTSKNEAKAAVEVLNDYCLQHTLCVGCEIEHTKERCCLGAMLLNIEWKDDSSHDI